MVWSLAICSNVDRSTGYYLSEISPWVSLVQSLHCVQLFATPWTATCQAFLSVSNSQSLLKFMSIESVMTSNRLILCCPLLLPQSFAASGSFPMSQFSPSGGQSIGVSATASVFPVNIQDWYPLGLTGLISLQFKGLSRVFYQHHSSKASLLWRSAFFMVQLSYLYMTTVKTIALTRWTFIGKVMSLFFNMLSRLCMDGVFSRQI